MRQGIALAARLQAMPSVPHARAARSWPRLLEQRRQCMRSPPATPRPANGWRRSRESAPARPRPVRDRSRARARRKRRSRSRCGPPRRDRPHARDRSATGRSSSRVRSGLRPAQAQRSSAAMRSLGLAAAAALIGVAGIGEAIAKHPLPGRQRRLDHFAHQLRARGEHQQQLGLRSHAVHAPDPAGSRAPPRPRRCRRARASAPGRCPAARGASRRPASKVLLPAPSPPSRLMNSPAWMCVIGSASAGNRRRCDCARASVLANTWRPSPRATK